MRRGRGIALIVAVTGALAAAPGGYAATPQEICRDLADGTLNGSYSAADIAAYVGALGSDPSVQGYCTPPTPTTPTTTTTTSTTTTGTTTTPGTTTTETTPPPPPTSGGGGVLPGESPELTTPTSGTAGVEQTAVQPLNDTRAVGTLPFTGTELTIFALVGLGLLASGLVLRSTGRQRS